MSSLIELSNHIEVIRGALHDLLEETDYDLLDSNVQSASRILNLEIAEYHRLYLSKYET